MFPNVFIYRSKKIKFYFEFEFTFLFFLDVFLQICWCFSILSVAKFLPQLAHCSRSSLGLEAKRERRSVVEEGAALDGLDEGLLA